MRFFSDYSSFGMGFIPLEPSPHLRIRIQHTASTSLLKKGIIKYVKYALPTLGWTQLLLASSNWLAEYRY
jgi:hypothetical protein